MIHRKPDGQKVSIYLSIYLSIYSHLQIDHLEYKIRIQEGTETTFLF